MAVDMVQAEATPERFGGVCMGIAALVAAGNMPGCQTEDGMAKAMRAGAYLQVVVSTTMKCKWVALEELIMKAEGELAIWKRGSIEATVVGTI